MLKNLKISAKILAIIICVSLVGLLLAGFGAVKMAGIDDNYSSLVLTKSPAVVKLVRTGRNVTDAAYSAYQVLAYDGASDIAKDKAANFANQMKAAGASLAEARAGIGGHEAALSDMAKGIGLIESQGQVAVALGLQDRSDEAVAALSDMDRSVDAFIKTYQALRDQVLAEVASESQSLTDQTWTTIYTMIGFSLAGLVFGIVGATLIAAKGITGPLSRLSGRMQRLASGELEAPIVGVERGDEIGAMARAMQVFKEAALDKRRIEIEAEESRRSQAASRDRQSALDTAKAEDLRAFVAQVEMGFTRLA
ncbi:HAMP domain-containing protein, partial [Aureimonas flava]